MTEAAEKTDDDQEDTGPQFYEALDQAVDLLATVRVEHHTPRLDGLRIRLIFTKAALSEQGEDVNTRHQKASAITRHIYEVDVWIIMREEFWQQHLADQVPEADVMRALDHELSAFDWDGKAGVLRFKRMPGEYPEVVERWGIDGLVELGDALKNYQTRMELDG